MQNDMQQSEAVEKNSNDNTNATRNAGEHSEAMQAAVAKVIEKKTKKGRVYGDPKNKQRQKEEKAKRLTPSQSLFVQGVLAGKTQLQAYRDAYNTGTRPDSTVSVDAHRLMRNPKVAALLAQTSESLKEKILEDAARTRQYVMERLHEKVQQGKTETTQLRALELMGKAVGMFTDRVEQTVEQINPQKLKDELKSSLALLDNVSPIRKREA